MALTIESESKQLSKLPTDIDRFRRKYIIKDGEVTVKLVSPIISGYEKNYYFLLKNSRYEPLRRRYIKRPDYLSKDEYGTIALWPILLFVNDVPCIENFDQENIYIPNYSAILDIIKFRESNLPEIDIEEAWNIEEKESPKLFSPSSRPDLSEFDTADKDQDEEPEEDQEELFYIREPFKLDEVDLYNRGLELAYTPQEQSLIMSISDKTITPLYDVHYTLVENQDDELKYVSWASSDNISGDGLENILEVGDKVEFLYAKEK